MKKLIYCIVCFLMMNYNSIAQEAFIETFLKSPEFSKIESQLSEFGTVNLSISKVHYFEDDKNKPVAQIAITADGTVKGIIEVVQVPENQENVLPNNERFAMQLIDYRLYDTKSYTGTIKTTDLNYDSYLSSVIEVDKSKVTKFNAYSIPEDIREK